MSTDERPDPGHRSWPALALAGVLHLAFLVTALLATAGELGLSWGERGAMVFFLAFFVLAEVAVLMLLDLAVEKSLAGVARRRPRVGIAVDALKALGLGLLVLLPALSLLKFVTARAHLRTTDVWFAVTNFGQLSQEVLGSELLSSLFAGLGFLGVVGGLFFLLRRGRRGAGARPEAASAGASGGLPPLTAAGAVALTLVALTGAGVSWWTHEAVPGAASLVVPEIHWLTRSASLPPAPAEAVPVGPPIVPWQPPRVGSGGSGGVAPHNVLLVMLESVPWARTGIGGGRPGATPHLDRLAAESVVFPRAYAPSVHSDYAQMAILSSLFPRKYEHHDYYQQLDYPRTLLWDALAPAGWDTAMFSCQNEAWGNMLRFLSTPGLELRVHSPDFPPQVPRRGRGAESKVYEEAVVTAWRDWLAARREAGREEPWLVYLNFQATHFPYTVPEDAPKPFAPWEIDFNASYLGYPRDKIPVMENRFHNALRYSDHWLGEVVATLEEAGELEDTLLVVVSDHGEAFYEHAQPTHGTALYEEQVRSLWLMRVPGEEPRWLDAPVSLMDVAPTVLARLGLPAHGNFQGADVLAPGYTGEGRPLFFTIQGMTFEDGLLLDGWKYMINWDQRAHRLFHLAEDPGERRNVAAEVPERTEALQRVLLGFLGAQLSYYEEEGWEAGHYPPALP